MVYYKIVNTFLYTIQWDLVVCPFFMKQLTSASPNFPLHPSANPLPQATTNLFSTGNCFCLLAVFGILSIFCTEPMLCLQYRSSELYSIIINK